MELKLLMMGPNMKETMKMVKKMALVVSIIQMDQNIKESSNAI